nr:uncharacterized protein LOC101139279 isoform X3 [Gorilla gorilla gorilla]
MPKANEGKQKSKGAPLPIVLILQKFLKTYEKHCAQSQTSVCPAIKSDLKSSIDSDQVLRKFMLVRPNDSPPRILPVSLEPLLMTIQDEHYTLAKEICIWGLQLSNPAIARLALLLELKGHTTCPFTTLEIIDCEMDLWSLERLGKALQFSSLHSLVLDYCNELFLDGNYLECSGALALLRPIAGFAETQGKDQPAPGSPDAGNPPQRLQAKQRGSSTMNQITKLSEAVTVKTTSGKKKRKKGIKKKIEGLIETGPWLVKLHLADNGIDGKGREGENGLLEFIQTLTCLIKYSACLREIDLGNNVLGEMAAANVLEALRARKTGKLPVLKITVTPQISSDTFRSIWKNSKKSNTMRKRRKRLKTEYRCYISIWMSSISMAKQICLDRYCLFYSNIFHCNQVLLKFSNLMIIV